MTQTLRATECVREYEEGVPSYISRLTTPRSIFDGGGPPDSGPAAYWDKKNNIWFNEDGNPIRDLRELGFSARMRETILMYIHQHEEDRYVGLVNDWGDSVELFW